MSEGGRLSNALVQTNADETCRAARVAAVREPASDSAAGTQPGWTRSPPPTFLKPKATVPAETRSWIITSVFARAAQLKSRTSDLACLPRGPGESASPDTLTETARFFTSTDGVSTVNAEPPEFIR